MLILKKLAKVKLREEGYILVPRLRFCRDVAVLELDSHPDNNIRPDPEAALVIRAIPSIDPNPI